MRAGGDLGPSDTPCAQLDRDARHPDWFGILARMQTPEAPGWYDDPDDAEQLRYFDGIVWSDRRVPKKVERPQPQPAPGQPGQGHQVPGGYAAGPTQPAGTDVYGRPTGGPSPQQRPRDPGYEQYGHDSYARYGAGETTADGVPLASYGQRAAAYLLDGLCVTVLNVVFAGWAGFLWMRPYLEAAVEDPTFTEGQSIEDLMAYYDWSWYAVYLGISLVVFALYHSLMVGLKGGGVGKLVLGLQVRKVDRPGPPGVGAAFMRILLPLGLALPLISWIILPAIILDLLWPLRDPRRQAWHDKIAGTQVVVPPKGPRRP